MVGDEGITAAVFVYPLGLLRGNPRLRTPGSDDGSTLVSISLLRASFLEQPLVGSGEWWSGVHL
jgi:hypothetical protein